MDFKKTVRLLTPITVPGVLSARRNSYDRLVEKLHELEFVTRSVTQHADTLVIELQILDEELLHQLLAGEANKFLLASGVSNARAIQCQDQNASWQAIEHYYAAYYGAHYLLRLTGVSVTSLESQSVNAIVKSSLGTLASGSLPGGLYVMKYNAQSKILILEKNMKRGAGGSHHDAWKLWQDLVDKLRAQTNVDPVEYASVSVDLAAHKNFLMRSSAKYSPPEIRGEINYQFKGGSWIFEAKAKDSIQRIQRSIASITAFPILEKSTVDGLISSNRVIIGLAKAVFQYAAEKYPKGVCRSLSNKYSNYVV